MINMISCKNIKILLSYCYTDIVIKDAIEK